MGLGSFLQFLSWPDFLLGLSAENNGTGFSNVFASFDDFGLTHREFRVWEGAGFAQDDLESAKSLTLNIGLRYERLGQFADRLGRNASFDIGKADPNPPPSGSMAGYIVASNFPGVLPPGVLRANNTFGTMATDKTRSHRESGLLGSSFPAQVESHLEGGMECIIPDPPVKPFIKISSALHFQCFV